MLCALRMCSVYDSGDPISIGVLGRFSKVSIIRKTRTYACSCAILSILQAASVPHTDSPHTFQPAVRSLKIRRKRARSRDYSPQLFSKNFLYSTPQPPPTSASPLQRCHDGPTLALPSSSTTCMHDFLYPISTLRGATNFTSHMRSARRTNKKNFRTHLRGVQVCSVWFFSSAKWEHILLRRVHTLSLMKMRGGQQHTKAP